MKTKIFFIALVFSWISPNAFGVQKIENKIFNKKEYFEINQKDTLLNNNTDTLILNQDTLNIPELLPKEKVESKQKKEKKSPFSSLVKYEAKDSSIYSIDGKKVFLFGEAKIFYEDIELVSGYIEIDMDKKILYAEGIPDSLGDISEQPVFKQGNETMQAKQLTYNIETKKGFIKGLYTEQEEGYLQSEMTKKEPNNSINMRNGKYSTCELKHPHFYLNLTRGKVVPDKAIVASYSFLVISDIPLYPIGLPFGYFPVKKERASGFIIPTFGEERNRGFYLRQGGYYFAVNDYFDFLVKGDVYSKGSWQIGGASNYKVRYKFGGSVSLNYAKVLVGETDLINHIETNTYSLKWTHRQDPKASPNSNFSASVNFSSSDNNKYNTVGEEYLSSSINSSVSYSKNFANTPFSASVNLRHNQNNQTKLYNFTVPQFTLNMSKIFPFRRKEGVGKTKWYENLGFTYSGNLENRFDGVHDSILFKPQMKDLMKNGMKHYIPVSTNIKVLKYFNMSPSFNFTNRTYINRTIIKYDAVSDTIYEQDQKGFYNVYDYSTGLNLNTKLYGMYLYKNKHIKALRHVVTPSVGLSYTPDFKYEKNGGYLYDPYTSEYYSPYKNNLYAPSSSRKSGSLHFGLENNLEMKVANKKDTVTGESKIKLLESLRLGTSYNMMADDFKWSNLSMSARTTLFKMLSINTSASGDFYGIDSTGNRINEFQHKINKGQLFRITSATVSTGIKFSSDNLFGRQNNTSNNVETEGVVNTYDDPLNPYSFNSVYSYDYFDVPWDLSFSYSLNYNKTGVKSSISQMLGFNGSVKLTDNWKINFKSGWDFEAKDFSYTSFNLSRDLHCWVATLSLIPFGPRQSYNFTIGVKAPVLQDLKYKKNKSWFDNNY